MTIYDLATGNARYIQHPKWPHHCDSRFHLRCVGLRPGCASGHSYSHEGRYLAVAERHHGKDCIGIYDVAALYALVRVGRLPIRHVWRYTSMMLHLDQELTVSHSTFPCRLPTFRAFCGRHVGSTSPLGTLHYPYLHTRSLCICRLTPAVLTTRLLTSRTASDPFLTIIPYLQPVRRSRNGYTDDRMGSWGKMDSSWRMGRQSQDSRE